MSFIAPKRFLNIYYDVKYSDKEKAKTMRLKWDPTIRKWYSKHEIYNCYELVDTEGLNIITEIFKIVDFKITDWRDTDLTKFEDEKILRKAKKRLVKQIIEKLKNI